MFAVVDPETRVTYPGFATRGEAEAWIAERGKQKYMGIVESKEVVMDDKALTMIEGMMLRAETDIAVLVETLLTHNAALQREVDELKANQADLGKTVYANEGALKQVLDQIGKDIGQLRRQVSDLDDRLEEVE